MKRKKRNKNINNKIYTCIAIGSLVLALGSYNQVTILTKTNIALETELEDQATSKTRLINQAIALKWRQEASNKQIEELENKIEALELENDNLRTIRATLTAYSPYDDIDGQQSQGDPSKTSIGLTPSRWIAAADPKKIPYGTILDIPDWGLVEIGDTGGALRSDNQNIRLDLYHQTYAEALAFGRQEKQIKIIKWGGNNGQN